MQTGKLLMMIGSAIASSRVGQSVGDIELDDVLGVVGLARRRSLVAQNLALLGVGVAVGAGVALLLAPASGSETRKRLGKSVEKLSERAAEKLEEAQELASAATGRTNGDAHNNGARHTGEI